MYVSSRRYRRRDPRTTNLKRVSPSLGVGISVLDRRDFYRYYKFLNINRSRGSFVSRFELPGLLHLDRWD